MNQGDKTHQIRSSVYASNIIEVKQHWGSDGTEFIDFYFSNGYMLGIPKDIVERYGMPQEGDVAIFDDEHEMKFHWLSKEGFDAVYRSIEVKSKAPTNAERHNNKPQMNTATLVADGYEEQKQEEKHKVKIIRVFNVGEQRAKLMFDNEIYEVQPHLVLNIYLFPDGSYECKV